VTDRNQQPVPAIVQEAYNGIIKVIDSINRASDEGIRIELGFAADPNTGRQHLSRFDVWLKSPSPLSPPNLAAPPGSMQ
jgi:hypothetical protein